MNNSSADNTAYVNTSRDSYDNRSITRIIFEKATFGSPPTHFRIGDDPTWHPVVFSQNPLLAQIMFADGSVSIVDADGPRGYNANRKTEKAYPDKTSDSTVSEETLAAISRGEYDEGIDTAPTNYFETWADNFIKKNREAEAIDSMEADLASIALTNTNEIPVITVEHDGGDTKPVDERAHFMGVGGAAAKTYERAKPTTIDEALAEIEKHKQAERIKFEQRMKEMLAGGQADAATKEERDPIPGHVSAAVRIGKPEGADN